MRKPAIIGVTVLAAVIFSAFVAFSVQSSASVDSKELLLVHVVLRHGARTPADTYPKDPYINETFYPVGWGQLTYDRKRDLYDIGRFLRARYSPFLGPTYSPSHFHAASTDVDRTKATTQLLNAGLWPPTPAQTWGPLAWQPIPVHSEPLAADSLLLVNRPCAQHHLEFQRVVNTPEIQAKLAEHQQLFHYLSAHTGNNISTFYDVYDLYSTLKAEEGFNLTLPDWTRGYYPDKLVPPTIFKYVLDSYTPTLRRLKGGVFVKKLIADWTGKVGGTLEKRAFVYCGHDSTIANVLGALGVWDPQLPEYGATILFELSRDLVTNTYGVEIFLRNTTAAPPHRLTIPGCAPFCPLSELIALTFNVTPSNWEEECHTDDPDYVPTPMTKP